MAGEIAVQQTLTAALLGEIAQCGFELTVQVDCSHNAHVQTVRADRPANPIIAKPIEIDATLKAFSDDRALGEAIGKLQAARSSSQLFQFYQALRRMSPGSTPVALSSLRKSALKIEFPRFDHSILNVGSPPASIADAIQACNAPTRVAFNALPDHVRCRMGMYVRRSATDFALAGAPEPSPRTAP